MAQLSDSEQNALAFRLIDSIVTASPNEVVRVLSSNGFVDKFPYGVNPQQAIIILQQLWIGNRSKFLALIRKMNIDSSRIPPADLQEYRSISSANRPNARVDEWLNGVLDSFSEQFNITPKTTTGEVQTTTEETTAGAYVAYVVIILAIIGIAFYLIRTPKA